TRRCAAPRRCRESGQRRTPRAARTPAWNAGRAASTSHGGGSRTTRTPRRCSKRALRRTPRNEPRAEAAADAPNGGRSFPTAELAFAACAPPDLVVVRARADPTAVSTREPAVRTTRNLCRRRDACKCRTSPAHECFRSTEQRPTGAYMAVSTALGVRVGGNGRGDWI